MARTRVLSVILMFSIAALGYLGFRAGRALQGRARAVHDERGQSGRDHRPV